MCRWVDLSRITISRLACFYRLVLAGLIPVAGTSALSFLLSWSFSCSRIGISAFFTPTFLLDSADWSSVQWVAVARWELPRGFNLEGQGLKLLSFR